MDELVRSLAYSVFGLIIGFIVGFITGRAACEDCNKFEEGEPVPKTFAQQDAQDRQRLTSLGVVVIILSIITVAGTAFSIVQQRQQQQCFNDFNVRMARSYIARAQAGDEDRKALTNLIYSLNTEDEHARRTAFTTYVENLRKTDVKRAANPIPQPPNPDRYCER